MAWAMPAYWPTVITSEMVVMPVQTLRSPSCIMERTCLAQILNHLRFADLIKNLLDVWLHLDVEHLVHVMRAPG